MSDYVFLDLPDLLQAGDLVVVNETRVRAARLVGRRSTGGSTEFLILGEAGDNWSALARPAKKLPIGSVVTVAGTDVTVVANHGEGLVEIQIDASDSEAWIAASGQLPLPPYFRGQLDTDDRYQTIFAAEPGSAAAPTAGLHFTPEVIRRLQARSVDIARVDLHVSLDTFRPVVVDQVEDHEMHSEWCHVPVTTAQAIQRSREDGGRVVAVGTTVVRALESLSDGHGGVRSGSMHTDLFLRPGVPLNVVDLLVTNFHMPRSSLLMLLAAFMGGGWTDAYTTALDRGYRFLSFGDSMLAERAT